MDADADHSCHKRIMLFRVYEHAVQTVIIEDAVVDTFRGSALWRSACGIWKKPRDPKYSDEEFDESVRKRVQALKTVHS